MAASDLSTPCPSWRRLPVGAEPAPSGGVHFRVWAPRRRSVEVVIDDASTDGDGEPRIVPLDREPGDDGYHSAVVPGATAGTRYRFRLDGGGSFPDPVSRWQLDGPHGVSVVVDPTPFAWTDAGWRGPANDRPVLYELHVGTFTAEGDWRAATRRLDSLSELGITCIELMPVGEFAGRFGWGYDGVDLFAPFHEYGAPDDMRAFVDRAHALGIAVILDVVYNHLGPDGNYLREFAETYFSARYTTDWGDAINFDGDDARPVREFALANARYWITELHLDGLRVDATQNTYDASPRHILAELGETVREAAGGRRTYLVAENEPQHVRIVTPRSGDGHGFDAMWNDDWHHTALVAITGRDEAYYADYAGSAAELVAAARFGFLYQGQWYAWQEQPRGTPARSLPPSRFVHFLENHDQVANSFRGDRLARLASPARIRALTALLLLGPQTPMLFQGQEFASSSPFLYFADHSGQLMDLVAEGRAKFLAQFQSIASPRAAACLIDPREESTFRRSKLDHSERERHAQVWTLHRDLIQLRRGDAALGRVRVGGVDGAVLREDTFLLRWSDEEEQAGDDRLLLVNLGGPLHLRRMPEPLLAPPAGCAWAERWSSEWPQYGGHCTPEFPPSMRDWYLPGESAVLFASEPSPRREPAPAQGEAAA
jgi:maltooligosyltrehalose trehalohydrolase